MLWCSTNEFAASVHSWAEEVYSSCKNGEGVVQRSSLPKVLWWVSSKPGLHGHSCGHSRHHFLRTHWVPEDKLQLTAQSQLGLGVLQSGWAPRAVSRTGLQGVRSVNASWCPDTPIPTEVLSNPVSLKRLFSLPEAVALEILFTSPSVFDELKLDPPAAHYRFKSQNVSRRALGDLLYQAWQTQMPTCVRQVTKNE